MAAHGDAELADQPDSTNTRAIFQAAGLALYNKERGKGTSSADIFDRLIVLGDAQPVAFRAMMDWEGLTAKSG